MGRGAFVTDEERGRVKGLSEAKTGIHKIARRVQRTPDTVRRVLSGVESDESERMGPAPLLSGRDARLLVRTDATDKFSAAQLKRELRFEAPVRTIQRILANIGWLVYSKMENTLPLTKANKVARKSWAWEMLLLKSVLWEHIIFSDEKKRNLDRPDGFQRYWRDLRKPPRQIARRQGGGGLFTVWGGFSASGKTKLAVLNGRQNSGDYVHTLSEFLLPFAHLRYGIGFVFQQDSASIHTSYRAKEFFEEQGIEVLD